MYRVFGLLRKAANLFLFITAISQIFLYETHIDSLERMIRTELLWRFLGNFGE